MLSLLLLLSLLTVAGPSSPAATVKHGESLSYPAMARMARVQGEVVLNVRLSERGEVVSTKVERGHPMLIQAADDNVRHWTFEGPVVDGDTVTIIYEFRLEGVDTSGEHAYATKTSFDFPPNRVTVTSSMPEVENVDFLPKKK